MRFMFVLFCRPTIIQCGSFFSVVFSVERWYRVRLGGEGSGGG